MELLALIKENIEATDYKCGQSIRGKGLEIFTTDYTVSSKYNNPNIFTKSEAKIEQEKILEKVRDRTKEFYLILDGEAEQHEINRVTFSKLNQVKSYKLVQKGKKLGYIKVREYDKSYDSQCELIRDVISLDNYDVDYSTEILTSSYDIFEDVREIETDYTSSYSGLGEGYQEVSGESLVYENDNEAEHIDTRLEYYDDNAIDCFWNYSNCGYDDMKNFIKEVDSDGEVTVYHRKGKDFYVTPSLYVHDSWITSFDEDGIEEDTNIQFIYQSSSVEDKIEKIVSYIKDAKKELEILGFIRDKDFFNKKIIESKMEIYEFESSILDCIDWKLEASIESIVTRAYDKFLQNNLKEKKLFGKFSHLVKLEKLCKRDGKELVYSKIGDFTEDMSFAIKFKKEEYHFSLDELFNSAPNRFYTKISDTLTKRLLERYEESILVKKAKNVFVGLEDSYKAGNCKFGTKQFCESHHIDTSKIGAIRGDALLEIDFSSFTKRAVMSAIARNSVAA